jgi:hypothetical protein
VRATAIAAETAAAVAYCFMICFFLEGSGMVEESNGRGVAGVHVGAAG